MYPEAQGLVLENLRSARFKYRGEVANEEESMFQKHSIWKYRDSTQLKMMAEKTTRWTFTELKSPNSFSSRS